MTRFFSVVIIVGIYFFVTGAYDFFIQAGTSSEPTKISISQLEKTVPSNRHLIVTGGQAMVKDSIVYYKTRRHAKVTGSEVYFVPVQEASLAAYQSLTPPLLLRITETQMDSIKENKDFNADSIRGVRMTHWDLDSKAEELLAKRYGQTAVKAMVVLEYEKAVTGIGKGIGQMFGGAVSIFLPFVLAFLMNPRLRRAS